MLYKFINYEKILVSTSIFLYCCPVKIDSNHISC